MEFRHIGGTTYLPEYNKCKRIIIVSIYNYYSPMHFVFLALKILPSATPRLVLPTNPPRAV